MICQVVSESEITFFLTCLDVTAHALRSIEFSLMKVECGVDCTLHNN